MYTPCTDKECQHRYTIGTATAHFTGWNEGYDAAQAPTTTRSRYTPCTGTRCALDIAAARLDGTSEGFSAGYAAAVEHAHAQGWGWPAPECKRCGAGSLTDICWDCNQKDNESE